MRSRVNVMSLAGLATLAGTLALVSTTTGKGVPPLRASQTQDPTECAADCPANQAFQEGFYIALPASSINGTHIFSIPSRKRLVIEQVTAVTLLPNLQHLDVTVQTSLSGAPGVLHFIEVTDKPVGTARQFLVSETVKLYADYASISVGRIAIPGLMGPEGVYGSISGHLVD